MHRDIVLIVLDSVRKDVFEAIATRTHDLSTISFDQYRAASSWSAPSHASMISGLLPHGHGVHTHSRSFDSLPESETVFHHLPEYRTVGISGNVYAGPAYGFDDYFDEFFELQRDVRFPEALTPGSFNGTVNNTPSYLWSSLKNKYPLKSLYNGALGFLGSFTKNFDSMFDEGAKPGLRLAQRQLEDSSKPTFLFLNLMEGHIPYAPASYLNNEYYDCPQNWSSNEKDVWDLILGEYDEQYWSRRNQLYQATVDYLDQCIADFVRTVDADTTVIITSDHGDNLGTETDQRLANHKSSLSEGVLHVPLCIINPPDIAPQSGQHLSQLQLPDLIKGIRENYIPDISTDQAIAEIAGMSAGPDPKEKYEYYDRALRCAYGKNEKIVWDSLGNCNRFELDSEKQNWQRHASRAENPPTWAVSGFKNNINEFKQQAMNSQDDVDIDSSTQSRLEKLGYL